MPAELNGATTAELNGVTTAELNGVTTAELNGAMAAEWNGAAAVIAEEELAASRLVHALSQVRSGLTMLTPPLLHSSGLQESALMPNAADSRGTAEALSSLSPRLESATGDGMLSATGDGSNMSRSRDEAARGDPKLLSTDHDGLDQELSTNRVDLGRTIEAIDDSDAECRKLRIELSATKDKLHAKETEQQQQRHSSEIELQRLRSELSAVKAAYHGNDEQQLQAKAVECEQLQLQLSQATAALSAKQLALDEKGIEYEVGLRLSAEEYQRLRTELGTAKAALDTQKAECQQMHTLKTDYQHLRLQLSDTKAALHAKQSELDAKQAECQVLTYGARLNIQWRCRGRGRITGWRNEDAGRESCVLYTERMVYV